LIDLEDVTADALDRVEKLGIIFLANLELGFLTPPVGLNLYMSSYRFGKPVPQVLMSVLPIIVGVQLLLQAVLLDMAEVRNFAPLPPLEQAVSAGATTLSRREP